MVTGTRRSDKRRDALVIRGFHIEVPTRWPQRVDHIRVPVVRCEQQHRGTIVRSNAWLCSGCQQRGDGRCMSILRRRVNGCVAKGIREVLVGSMREQHPDHFHAPNRSGE